MQKELNEGNFVDKVVASGLCSGCGLCAGMTSNENIRMDMSSQGFLRPVSLSRLGGQDLAIFKEVCPGVTVSHKPSDVKYDPLWGPVVATHAAYSTDDTVRRNGSSGGVISAFLIYLLDTKQIDFVAQIAASDDDPIRNDIKLSRTREDVLRAAGSRYGPSAPLSKLSEILEKESGNFAFVGKPCDVAALRQYLRVRPEIAPRVPFLFSFMCAGVPSEKGTLELLKQLGVDQQELKSFRYRGDGWPGKAKAVTKSDDVHEMDYATSWGTILNRHLQYRCKICADGTGEFADIVCADAWYGKDGYPDFAERAGRSLLISRTNKGQTLLEEAVRDSAIVIEDLDIKEISKMQPYQENRKQMALGRVIATKLAIGLAPRYKGLKLIKTSLMANPLEWLKGAAGTFRRAKSQI
jgi:coenzyme F420 hydrogenase subunit beta